MFIEYRNNLSGVLNVLSYDTSRVSIKTLLKIRSYTRINKFFYSERQIFYTKP
jgi:hypothetical protein